MSGMAPGWYPDPDPRSGGTSTVRWWDGERWTEHLGGPGGGPTYGQDPRARTPDGEELAGWGRRLGASVLDSLITLTVSTLLALPFWREIGSYYLDVIRRSVDAAESGGPVQAPGTLEIYGDLAGPLLAITAIGLVVSVAYHAGFLRWRGATPGKTALGMRVRLRERPGRLPWSAVGKRLAVQYVPSLFTAIPFVGALVGLFPFLDGLWPLWDDKRQALHDKAAGTNVVRVS